MKHPLLISSFALAASVSAACSDFETGDLQGTVGKADFAERRAEAAVRELGAKFPSYPAAAFLGRLAQLRAEKASRAALDDFLKAALVRANPLVNAHEIVYTTRDMWAQDRVEQVIFWMFTVDGVPMLFNGNEFAEAAPDHSMFGKTPLDWKARETPAGRRRAELVKRLSQLRRTRPAFTAANGHDGLAWLDTTRPEAVAAFVRRGGGETLLVLQNWTDKPAACDVSFTVPEGSYPSYLAVEKVDRDVKGTVRESPLIARDTNKTGARSFALGPFGYAVYEVK